MQNISHSKNLHTFSELHTIPENSNYGYGTFEVLPWTTAAATAENKI